ncbi:MAG: glutamate ABC transporter substrate-binding protein [Acidimicrobiales bacterium]
MRRQRWLAPVLVTVALMAAACGDSGDDTPTVGGGQSSDTTLARPTFAPDSTMGRIQAKGKLVLGTKYDQPGLGQKNPLNNQVEGFDVEIAKIVAAGIFGGKPSDIGSKIEYKETTTPNREIFLETGQVDIVVATYTINDPRKLRIDFGGPYYVAAQDILVRADNTSIKTANDLGGKKVCSVLNSTPAGRIRTMVPTAELVEFATYSLCKDELIGNRVDAVTTDDAILIGFASENPRALKVVGNRFSTEPYGIGISARNADGQAGEKAKGAKADDAFRTFINDTLEASYKNGTWLAAFDSTLGKSGVKAPTPPPVDRYSSTAAAAATTTTAKP